MPEQPVQRSFEEHLEIIGNLTHGEPSGFEFRMPVRPKEVDRLTEFSFAALTAYLNSKNMTSAITSTLKFVASKHVGAYVISLAADQLLNTALADTLDALGDTDARTASNSLALAAAASTERERRAHRDRAQNYLEGAYSKYEGSINASKIKDATSLHLKAARTALVVAVMDYDQGFNSARHWAENGKAHYTHYDASEREKAQAKVDSLERLPEHMYIAGMANARQPVEKILAGAGGWLLGASLRAIRRNGVEATFHSRIGQLDHDRQQLDQLHKLLVAPPPTTARRVMPAPTRTFVERTTVWLKSFRILR